MTSEPSFTRGDAYVEAMFQALTRPIREASYHRERGCPAFWCVASCALCSGLDELANGVTTEREFLEWARNPEEVAEVHAHEYRRHPSGRIFCVRCGAVA